MQICNCICAKTGYFMHFFGLSRNIFMYSKKGILTLSKAARSSKIFFKKHLELENPRLIFFFFFTWNLALVLFPRLDWNS